MPHDLTEQHGTRIRPSALPEKTFYLPPPPAPSFNTWSLPSWLHPASSTFLAREKFLPGEALQALPSNRNLPPHSPPGLPEILPYNPIKVRRSETIITMRRKCRKFVANIHGNSWLEIFISFLARWEAYSHSILNVSKLRETCTTRKTNSTIDFGFLHGTFKSR